MIKKRKIPVFDKIKRTFKSKISIKSLISLKFIYRHSLILSILCSTILLSKLNSLEMKTIFLFISIEMLTILLSGVAVYSFTRFNFNKHDSNPNLGLIFLGVHICVGLSALGTYLSQFY